MGFILKNKAKSLSRDIDLASILIIKSMNKNDKTKYKALCDTGASSTVIGEKLANYGPITVNNSPKIFTTTMGNFTNEFSSDLTFQLPELSNSLELTWQCDVVKDLSNTSYDMIIGRYVLKD